MKISIIGSGGSGKTTLALKISEKLNIPHLHLDRLWFEAKGHDVWKNTPENKDAVREHIKQEVQKFITQPAWVSDGWYWRVQPLIAEQADQIIFLKIPLWRRLLNHLHRDYKHPELTLCDNISHLFTMIRRTFTDTPRIREFVRQHSNKVITLRNYKEIQAYLEKL